MSSALMNKHIDAKLADMDQTIKQLVKDANAEIEFSLGDSVPATI